MLQTVQGSYSPMKGASYHSQFNGMIKRFNIFIVVKDHGWDIQQHL